MLRKGLVVMSVFAGLIALSAGCGGSSSSDDGGGGTVNTSMTINVDYTGAGTVSNTAFILCAATSDTGELINACQIYSASGSCTIEDITESTVVIMVTHNADASPIDMVNGTGTFTIDDPWVMYDDVNPALVFSDPANNLPDNIDLAATSSIDVTLTDAYKVTQAALDDMAAIK